MAKIEKILFYLFLFLIPLQLRAIISWQGSEWNSVFLYFTDILLVGVFILAAVNRPYKSDRSYRSYLLLAAFLLLALISVFKSVDAENSVYRLIKLAEFIGLYIYISSQFKSRKSPASTSEAGRAKIKNSPPEAGPPWAEKFKIKTIFSVIFYSGVFQAILAIAQFYKQSSLGLKFIEAGSYTPGEAGVATFISGTEKVMRAYGSFPHPNVLSAFLLLAIFCFYALWLKSEKPPVASRQLPITSYLLRITDYVLRIISYGLLVFSLFLTFSRGTIMVFVFISFGFFIARFFQLRELYHTDERLVMGKRMMTLAMFFVVFSVISVLLVMPYFTTRFTKISVNEEAIDLRFFYNKMAVEMIKEKPVLGIGIGNFANYSRDFPAFLRAANKIYNSGGLTGKEIPEWLYQPAHNLYLLIASEIGILGALIFILFLAIKFIKNIGRIKPREVSDLAGPMIFLFIGFIVLGLNDHYFWSLQSGGIIFWISFALIENSYTENGK